MFAIREFRGVCRWLVVSETQCGVKNEALKAIADGDAQPYKPSLACLFSIPAASLSRSQSQSYVRNRVIRQAEGKQQRHCAEGSRRRDMVIRTALPGSPDRMDTK